jgi:two-component system chemotaxis family response regulator WspR
MDPTILIVDDSKTIKKSLTKILQKHNYNNIYHSGNTTGTFKILEIHSINVILMDVRLQDSSGIELTRLIRKIDDYKNIPIIIITSIKDIRLIQEAFDSGANDFLQKPFYEIEIIARIRSAINLMKEIEERSKREKELIERERELISINRLLEIANQTYLRSNATDELTQLTNKRYFNEFFQSEYERTKIKKQPISLILIDIDHFKLYNDNYGHQLGDSCLHDVAQAIEKSLTNAKDIAARVGGEEFAVIAPDSKLEQAYSIAEKIRKSVYDLQIIHKASSTEFVVTVSIGLANSLDSNVADHNELFKVADIQLYEAKNNGRNQVQPSLL